MPLEYAFRHNLMIIIISNLREVHRRQIDPVGGRVIQVIDYLNYSTSYRGVYCFVFISPRNQRSFEILNKSGI